MRKVDSNAVPIVQTPMSNGGYNWSQHDSWHKIFLAGSIEGGAAEEWQQYVISKLEGLKLNIFNPRRDDWSPLWKEGSNELIHQIKWELDGLRECNTALFYFDPETKSPISIAELYMMLEQAPKKLIVICPDGFYRKTNIVVTCVRYGVQVMSSLDDAVIMLKSK